ncbi:MAG: chemotaxis protein CheB, partial [Pseudomonadota bacterium]|nr:chemotaxis protein CheB [Pseudomonadota bacterium]
PEYIHVESEVAGMNMAAIQTDRAGDPSGYACPECHGVLWEIQEGELVRFRCRVGHAYSPDSLLASQSQGLEDALWVALRALEESASLARRLSERAGQRGHSMAASRFEEQAEDTLQRAAIVRRALVHEQVNVAAPGAEPEEAAE